VSAETDADVAARASGTADGGAATSAASAVDPAEIAAGRATLGATGEDHPTGQARGPMALRTERALVRGLAAVRVAQFVSFGPAALTAKSNAYHWGDLALWLYGAACVWSIVLYTHGLRRNGFGTRWVVADVVLMASAALVVGLACLPGRSFTWDNWTTGPATGAAVIAVVYARRWLAAAGLTLLVTAHLIATRSDIGVPGAVGSITAHTVSLVGFSLAAALMVGSLRASARRSDELALVALEAQHAESSIRARLDERTRQYRLLHDTVLSTLSAISRGGLDHRTRAVQERCARDAAYLRGLITGGEDDTPTGLGAALSTVIREQEALDLDVQPHFDGLPKDVPDDVVEAISSAVREALNNVAKHAGTKHAWLMAIGSEDGSLSVSVTDRGSGADLTEMSGGLGITGSIRDRMAEIGGAAVIHSAVGEGTTVEITWPR
jgi:signal transduction histidine kinase